MPKAKTPSPLQGGVIVVSGFHLKTGSHAATALREWKLAGGTYKELIEAALESYAHTEAYKGSIAAMRSE